MWQLKRNTKAIFYLQLDILWNMLKIRVCHYYLFFFWYTLAWKKMLSHEEKFVVYEAFCMCFFVYVHTRLDIRIFWYKMRDIKMKLIWERRGVKFSFGVWSFIHDIEISYYSACILLYIFVQLLKPLKMIRKKYINDSLDVIYNMPKSYL